MGELSSMPSFLDDVGDVLQDYFGTYCDLADEASGLVDNAAIDFGRYLRGMREADGLSRKELAEKAMVAEGMVLVLEHGLVPSETIEVEVLHGLAKALGNDVEMFGLLLERPVPRMGWAGYVERRVNDWRAWVAYFGSRVKAWLMVVVMGLVLVGAMVLVPLVGSSELVGDGSVVDIVLDMDDSYSVQNWSKNLGTYKGQNDYKVEVAVSQLRGDSFWRGVGLYGIRGSFFVVLGLMVIWWFVRLGYLPFRFGKLKSGYLKPRLVYVTCGVSLVAVLGVNLGFVSSVGYAKDFEIRWYKSGEQQQSDSPIYIPAEYTNAGEVWSATIPAYNIIPTFYMPFILRDTSCVGGNWSCNLPFEMDESFYINPPTPMNGEVATFYIGRGTGYSLLNLDWDLDNGTVEHDKSRLTLPSSYSTETIYWYTNISPDIFDIPFPTIVYENVWSATATIVNNDLIYDDFIDLPLETDESFYINSFVLGKDFENNQLPQVNFATSVHTATEKVGNISVVSVSLSLPSSLTITVNLATSDETAISSSDYTLLSSDGTAFGSSDYTLSSSTLIFSPSQITTFTVKLLGDTLNEIDEISHIDLSSPVNAVADLEITKYGPSFISTGGLFTYTIFLPVGSRYWQGHEVVRSYIGSNSHTIASTNTRSVQDFYADIHQLENMGLVRGSNVFSLNVPITRRALSLFYTYDRMNGQATDSSLNYHAGFDFYDVFTLRQWVASRYDVSLLLAVVQPGLVLLLFGVMVEVVLREGRLKLSFSKGRGPPN